MKRFLFLLLALYITVQVSAVSYLVNGLFYTKIAGTKKTVQLYEGYQYRAITSALANAGGTITIPSTVVIDGETYTVVRIGDSAFTGCQNITNIIIPNTVKSIGREAFLYTGITSIEIPNSVQIIEESAFQSSHYLKSVKLSNNGSEIDKNAFYNCDLLSSIVIPRGVTAIGDKSFGENCNLEKVFVRNSDASTITWGNNIFNNNNHFTLYVPPGSTDRFVKSVPWYYCDKIVEEGSNALHFDGVNDYVSLPMQFYKHGAFTIEMWIKPDAIPATGIVSLLNTNSWNTDANGASVHFQISDSKLSLAINGINDGHPTSSYTPIPNVWQHIAVTYARGIAVKFYVNGNLVSTVIKGYVMPLAKIDDACLGSWGGTSRFFNGAIDEVRVWNEVLTEQQIRDNMNVSFENTSLYMPNPQYFPSYLDLNYNFNQGVASQNNIYATELTDYSSKYTDGTLHNFTLDGGTSNFVKGVDFPILQVTQSTANVNAANNSQTTINVRSNVKWYVLSDQSWLKANVDSSIGNGEFILTATENPTNDARIATVTVSATGVLDKIITVTQIANTATGIETPNEEMLTFSPNPASDSFTINVGMQKSMIYIYDSNGSLVLSKQIEGKSYVDITSLSSGIYMVKANGIAGKLIKK